MATLTSDYQYLGRSVAYPRTDGTGNYYLLVYAKAIPNGATKKYTLHAKCVIASDIDSSFYNWASTLTLSGSVSWGGAGHGSASLWKEYSKTPNEVWGGVLTAGGITYQRHFVLCEYSTERSYYYTTESAGIVMQQLRVGFTYKFEAIGAAEYTPRAGSSVVVDVQANIPALPMATTIDSFACSTEYLDGELTVLYTPQSNLYYTNRRIIVYADGAEIYSTNFKIGQKEATQQSLTTRYSEAQLEAIFSKMPRTDEATLKLIVKTYSDSAYTAQVGEDQTASITLKIPNSENPIVTTTVSPSNSNEWIAARNIYVAGYTNAEIRVSAEVGVGATLASRWIDHNGAVYETSEHTAPLRSVGENAIIGYAADSRGRTSSDPQTIDVLSYSVPAITSVLIERGTYDSDWTADDSGPDVRVGFKTTLSLADNGNTYNAVFKIDGVDTVPNYGATTGLESGTRRYVYFVGLTGDISHALQLTVTDSVGNSGSATLTIPTLSVTMEFKANGKGISFGKASEHDAFECAMDAEFSGNVSFMCTDKMKEAIRESLGIRKDIWSGTCTAGQSITVNELQNYMMYRVTMSGLSVVITAHRSGSYLTGIGGAEGGTGHHRTYIFSARILDSSGEYSASGNVVQLTRISSLDHTGSGAHEAPVDRTLVKITGLL